MNNDRCGNYMPQLVEQPMRLFWSRWLHGEFLDSGDGGACVAALPQFLCPPCTIFLLQQHRVGPVHIPSGPDSSVGASMHLPWAWLMGRTLLFPAFASRFDTGRIHVALLFDTGRLRVGIQGVCPFPFVRVFFGPHRDLSSAQEMK